MKEREQSQEDVEYDEEMAKFLGQTLSYWFGNGERSKHDEKLIKRANKNHKRTTYRDMLRNE